MSLIIAGDRSGVGKTTITLALLAWLRRQSCRVQSFKVGPDYIDPMFHAAITQRPCRNLDPLLTSEDYVRQCFTRHSQGMDYALIEGVMGLFDGVNYQGSGDFASTAHVARILDIPVLLVVNCRRLSGSIAALVQGHLNFDSRVKFAGLILNKVGSDRHRELLAMALQPLSLPILGIIPRQEEITLPHRHLGLVPASELSQLSRVFENLTKLAQQYLKVEKLLPRLEVESSRAGSKTVITSSLSTQKPVRIALAKDHAFNFYYQDNLDILSQLGAELLPWSPLEDNQLPPRVQGLFFGGGFPEVFAPQLAANKNALQAVSAAIKKGIPTYCECGGLMYLCRRLRDFEDNSWPMVGVLPTNVVMSKHLTLGYRQAEALGANWLVPAGKKVWGHEFHRSQITAAASNPAWLLNSLSTQGSSVGEGWQISQVHASYLHLHFGVQTQLMVNFLELSRKYTA